MSKVTTTFEAVDTGMVATIQKIELETKSMKDTTEKAEKSISFSFGAMAAAGAGLALGIGVVKGAFAAITGTIDKFGQALDMGGRLADLSARTGETAGNLLLLERAFDNSGIGADKVGTAINKLQKFMVGAKDGATENMNAMNQLGISYDMIKEMTPTEQMGMFAEKISAIISPAERSAAAMAIFGKSGGELLPLLMNFSGEIGNASDELGSMGRIMDEKNAVFDTISDKIEVVKGKFVEFAAGLLSKFTPALELVVTALSRIDAAAIGEKLANAFIGGQKAMEGFNAALSAMKMGNFADAWLVAIKSVELQIKQTINQIYTYVTALIDGIIAAVKSLFGPGSALLNIITSSFEFIAAKMLIIITKGLSTILSEIPGVGDALADSLKLFERGADVAANKVKNGFQDIIPQAKDAASAFGDAFENSFKSTKPLIDTLKTESELLEMKNKITADGIEKSRKETEKLGEKTKDGGVFVPMEKAADRIYLKMRKTGDDVKGMVEKIKELSNVEKLTLELKEAKTGKGTKEEEKRAKELIEAGKFKQAERAIKKVREKEIEDEIRINKEGELDKRSIADIAKEEGIKTFGKSKEQLKKEILEKRKGKTLEDLMREKEEKKEGKKEPEKKADPLLEMVRSIKELVAKIEPKLPTHALGL